MSNSILTLTESNFESTLKTADKPVLVDFWAEWCGPCKMIAPVLEQVAAELGDKVIIGKVNVDQNKTIPSQFGIRGIPTLILFKNGEAVATQVGAVSKPQLVSFIENNL